MQGLIGVKPGFFTQRHFFASSVVPNGQNRVHAGCAIEGLADNVHTPSTTADNTIARSRSFLAETILISSLWSPEVVNAERL